MSGAMRTADAAGEIRAEIVATVLDVQTEVGRPVSDGDVLLLLESMKMEIPVAAEGPGRVTQVAVRPGDTVQEGDLLAVVGEPVRGESVRDETVRDGTVHGHGPPTP